MTSASEMYTKMGKGKKAPGQWLSLKTTKAFMKATGSSYKRKGEAYDLDEALLTEYKCYLEGIEKKDETSMKEEDLIEYAVKGLKKCDYAEKVSQFFIQRICGLAYNKIHKETGLSKTELMSSFDPSVKTLWRICVDVLELSAKRHKVINWDFLKAELIDTMLFLEGRGLRGTYDVIASNDKFQLTYGKVKIK